MIKDAIYKISADTRIRHENDQYILINIATQGLHFVSETAYSFVEKIDGIKTIDEIIHELWPNITDESRNQIYSFVDKLYERRILTEAGKI